MNRIRRLLLNAHYLSRCGTNDIVSRRPHQRNLKPFFFRAHRTKDLHQRNLYYSYHTNCILQNHGRTIWPAKTDPEGLCTKSSRYFVPSHSDAFSNFSFSQLAILFSKEGLGCISGYLPALQYFFSLQDYSSLPPTSWKPPYVSEVASFWLPFETLHKLFLKIRTIQNRSGVFPT